MFNVGPGELFAILALALVVLGPDRLPVALRTGARLVGEARRATTRFQDELRTAAHDGEDADDVTPPAADDGGDRVDPAA